MSLLIKGITKLSELTIDAAKDWAAKKIENLGAPDSADDAKRHDSAPAAHKGSHENTGGDEISVAGLSGVLADDQHVIDAEVLAVAAAKLHEATHVAGGTDDIDSALAIAAMANLTATKIWQGDGGNRPVEVAMPTDGYTQGARVYHSLNQSIPNATWTALNFDSEDFDTDTIHDTVTNNTRLTCKTAGKYLVYSSVFWTANATGDRLLRIIEGGVTTWGRLQKPGPSGDSNMEIVTVVDLSVNDYLEAEVWQNSGAALTIDSGGVTFQLHFGMQRIG